MIREPKDRHMANIPIGAFNFEPEVFKHFDNLMRKNLMYQWFFENFEDPWNTLSYDRENGFVWGENGPHDARDELEQLFGELVSEVDIVEVSMEIEKKGIVWARKDHLPPTPLARSWGMKDVEAQRPYRSNDAYWRELKEHVIPAESGSSSQPSIHDDYFFADHSFAGHGFAGATPKRQEDIDPLLVERRARIALQAELAKAREELDSLKHEYPRNHNNPPEELEVDHETAAQVINITITIERLEVHAGQPKPDISKVMSEVSRLRSALRWWGARATAYFDGLAPAITVAYASPEKLNAIVDSLYRAAANWADALLRIIS